MYELFQSMGQIQKGSIAPTLSRDAAIKLKTGTYITGSYQKFGDKILTYVKLIDTKSDELLWTGSIDGGLDSYKHLADSISGKLKDFLEIKAIKQKANGEFNDVNTNSPEALKRYIEGMQLMINGNFKNAALSFESSFRIDTTFALAPIYASFSHSYENDFAAAVYWTKEALKVKARLPYYYQLWCESAKACNIIKDADSALFYNDLLANSDIKSRLFWFDIGYNYLHLSQYQKAINAFEKVQTISSEWGGDWKYRLFYRFYGNACHNAGYHERESEITETGLKLFPGDFMLIYQQALCSLVRGDSANASMLAKKLVAQVKETGATESDIENGYGKIYEDAGLFENAEKHYRAALKSDPKNPLKINTLAMFIVRHGTNIQEAEKLSGEVLKLKPDDLTGLWVKGLVQYKQGKYEDAVKNMEQALSISPVWNIRLFYDLKAAKKAGEGLMQ